jgi:hypothetical protein
VAKIVIVFDPLIGPVVGDVVVFDLLIVAVVGPVGVSDPFIRAVVCFCPFFTLLFIIFFIFCYFYLLS